MENRFLMKSDRHPDGYLFYEDLLLDGFDVRQVVEALHNEPGTLTTERLHKVVQDIVDSQLQDLWAIVNENDEEIIAAATKADRMTRIRHRVSIWTGQTAPKRSLAISIHGVLNMIAGRMFASTITANG